MSAPESLQQRRSGDIYVPGQGLPLGLPVTSSDDEVTLQVRDEFPAPREPNTSSVSTPSVRSGVGGRRVSRRALARLATNLSERDELVLRRVAEHRYLTTHQLQGFCFAEHASDASASRTTRRVLARLERDGLVRALERRIGGVHAGSQAAIWQLAPAGSRLVYGEEKRRRSGPPSDRFLRHQLAVADVHVLLQQHQRIEAIEQVAVEVEPASWRRYQGPSGEPRWLQPDLFAEITSSDFVDRYFIEVDLGTESLPTLLGKCEQYEQYLRSGVEQARCGGYPLVLWLFLTPERAASLKTAVRRSGRLTNGLYRYATPETITQVLAGGGA